MSNIYAANSIYTKYRSEKIDWHKQTIPTLEKEVVGRLARMEHSRWNMEKLLVGFSAMTKEARTNLNNRLLSNDPQEQTQAQAMCDELKDVEFIHRDIAPYDELLDSSRNFDIAIVKNLKDVIDTHKEKCK